MKDRRAFTIDGEVLNQFEQICCKIEKKWGTTISRSQLVESMIIGWIKKNKI
jgi:hypothetical protein